MATLSHFFYKESDQKHLISPYQSEKAGKMEQYKEQSSNKQDFSFLCKPKKKFTKAKVNTLFQQNVLQAAFNRKSSSKTEKAKSQKNILHKKTHQQVKLNAQHCKTSLNYSSSKLKVIDRVLQQQLSRNHQGRDTDAINQRHRRLSQNCLRQSQDCTRTKSLKQRNACRQKKIVGRINSSKFIKDAAIRNINVSKNNSSIASAQNTNKNMLTTQLLKISKQPSAANYDQIEASLLKTTHQGTQKCHSRQDSSKGFQQGNTVIISNVSTQSNPNQALNKPKATVISQYYEKMMKSHDRFFKKIGHQDPSPSFSPNSSQNKQVNSHSKTKQANCHQRQTDSKHFEVLINEYKKYSRKSFNRKSSMGSKACQIQKLIINELSELRKRRNSGSLNVGMVVGTCPRYQDTKQCIEARCLRKTSVESQSKARRRCALSPSQKGSLRRQHIVVNSHMTDTYVKSRDQMVQHQDQIYTYKTPRKESLLRKNSLYLLDYLRQKSKSSVNQVQDLCPHINNLSNVVVPGTFRQKKIEQKKSASKAAKKKEKEKGTIDQRTKVQFNERAGFNSMRIQPW